MTSEEAFFTVHRDLPREGPGLPEDVLWALGVADTPMEARILDAACGPGADTVTLVEARPGARIDAVDLHPGFIEAARARTACFGDRVRAEVGSYADLSGSYDLIWCAGAVYFFGFEKALAAWRPHLAEGGRIAFSEPAWAQEPPSEAARAFWTGYSRITSEPDIRARLAGAGWQVLGRRWLIGDAWAAYYAPLKARAAQLRTASAEPELLAAIDDAEREIAAWETARDEIAYSLYVVGPA